MPAPLIGPRFFRRLASRSLLDASSLAPTRSASQPVAIVNEAFAKKFNLGRDAVGTRMELGRNNKPKFDIEIVGLVQDANTAARKTTRRRSSICRIASGRVSRT